MKTLSKEQVLRLHNALLETFGGTAGIRDDGLLESALKCSFCYIRRAVSISIRAGKGGTAWIWLSLQSPIRGWQQAHRRPRYAGFSGN